LSSARARLPVFFGSTVEAASAAVLRCCCLWNFQEGFARRSSSSLRFLLLCVESCIFFRWKEDTFIDCSLARSTAGRQEIFWKDSLFCHVRRFFKKSNYFADRTNISSSNSPIERAVEYFAGFRSHRGKFSGIFVILKVLSNFHLIISTAKAVFSNISRRKPLNRKRG